MNDYRQYKRWLLTTVSSVNRSNAPVPQSIIPQPTRLSGMTAISAPGRHVIIRDVKVTGFNTAVTLNAGSDGMVEENTVDIEVVNTDRALAVSGKTITKNKIKIRET